MRTDISRYFAIFLILLIVSGTSSCSEGSGRKAARSATSVKADAGEPAIRLVKMVSPAEDASFRLYEPVRVELGLVDRDRMPDSVIISFDGQHVASLKSAPWEFSIPSSLTTKTGRKSVKVTAYSGRRFQSPVTRFLVFLADKPPEKWGYRVVHTYPHDPDAFTQGLVYDDGVMYEGTGQKTGSSLREVDLQTGKVLRQLNLDPSLFGEGITVYGERIYQVTWENKVGFVYDKATFNLINKIYYSTQGWGLTTIGERIAMSDGSNIIGFYEPEMFTMVSRIEVYDDRKKVDSLNELEYINGEIWANIWMSDLIARIDPVSGKVLGYINMKGILPRADRAPDTDVLNGIAWDKRNRRIFVTGKRWPKLFEITVAK